MLMAKEKIETQGDGTNNQNNLAHWSSGELDNHAQRMRLKQMHKVGQENKITEMGERKTKVAGNRASVPNPYTRGITEAMVIPSPPGKKS